MRWSVRYSNLVASQPADLFNSSYAALAILSPALSLPASTRPAALTSTTLSSTPASTSLATLACTDRTMRSARTTPTTSAAWVARPRQITVSAPIRHSAAHLYQKLTFVATPDFYYTDIGTCGRGWGATYDKSLNSKELHSDQARWILRHARDCPSSLDRFLIAAGSPCSLKQLLRYRHWKPQLLSADRLARTYHPRGDYDCVSSNQPHVLHYRQLDVSDARSRRSQCAGKYADERCGDRCFIQCTLGR